MTDLAEIILPVFGLMALGFFSSWSGLLSARSGEGVSEFVSNIAIPALIFKTMASATLPDAQPWGYWLAYFSAVAIIWALAMLAGARLFRLSFGEGVIAGFVASQSNTVLVGIPLLLRAFGEPAAVPLFLLIAIHLPIMVTTATVLIEGRGNVRFGTLAQKLLLNPILLAIFLGLAWRATGLGFSGPLKSIIEQLSAAAIPCALVAMGLALRRYGLHEDISLSAVVTGMKLVVHPALVYLFATRIFTMPPAWAGIAVLFAAMPSGVNSYLFAQRYKTGMGLTSGTISLSTALSVVTTPIWLWFLGVGGG